MQFQKYFRHEHQTRCYSIAVADAGWEIREEHNGEVVKRVQCKDWHRVERAWRSLGAELESLRRDGWFEQPSSSQ